MPGNLDVQATPRKGADAVTRAHLIAVLEEAIPAALEGRRARFLYGQITDMSPLEAREVAKDLLSRLESAGLAIQRVGA